LYRVVAEVLIAIVAVVGLVVFLTIDVHGKARAFEKGTDPAPTTVATNVELPTGVDPDGRRDV
jgi:hypothetical protein